MQVRSISAILVWVAIALLLLNIYLGLPWVFLTCIALVIIAVVIYFIPRHRR